MGNMVRSLLGLFLAVLFVVGYAAGIAYAQPPGHGKGGNPNGAVFESAMVEDAGFCLNTNGQCDLSEGKVTRNGSWKVELTLDIIDCDLEVFDICLVHKNGFAALAEDVSPDEDCELKETGAVPNDLYISPSLEVRVANGDACSGATDFATGFSF